MEIFTNLFFEALQLSIELEGESRCGIHHFNIAEYVAGRLRLESVGGVSVWHGELKMKAVQYLHFNDPELDVDLCTEEVTLLPEGWLSGSMDIPFAFDFSSKSSSDDASLVHAHQNLSSFSLESQSHAEILRRLEDRDGERAWGSIDALDKSPVPNSVNLPIQHMRSDGMPNLRSWLESYEGQCFSIRHKLVANVSRAWYSSALTAEKVIQMHRIAFPGMRKLQNPVNVIVPDCGGKCVLELPSRWVEIGGLTAVTVTLQNLKRPITSLHLLLVKAEYLEEISVDRVVLVHRLFGYGTAAVLEDIPEDAIYTEGFYHRVDETDDCPRPDDPVMRGAQFDFDLRFQDFSVVGLPPDLSSVSYSDNDNIVTGTTPSLAGSSVFGEQNFSVGVQMPGGGMFSLAGGNNYISRHTTPRTESWGRANQNQNRHRDIQKFGQLSKEPSFDNSSNAAGKMQDEDPRPMSHVDSDLEVSGQIFYPSFDTSAEGLSVSRVEEQFELDYDSRGNQNLFEEQETQVPLQSDAEAGGVKNKLENSASGDDMEGRVLEAADGERGRTRSTDGHSEMSKSFDAATLDERTLARSISATTQRTLSTQESKSSESRDVTQKYKDTVAVRYYLRLVVQDAFERICWNTTELMLYRGQYKPFPGEQQEELPEV